ncbi:hypothetical protein ACLBKU_12500 [Erythrobacter sp. NE805]|uniref:hypothetical protein n=1 Tax=Erythrobacter sp. NE805 TaxID=3389875 RepID=UPI00396B2D75
MAHRKLDMGQAWTQATGMVGANRDLVGVLAGLFLFLPMFVLIYALFTSGMDFGSGGGEPDPEKLAAQINAFLLANWWGLLLTVIGQIAGGIAILALLADPRRPTVREALGRIPRLALPAIGAQALIGIVTQLPSLVTGALPAASLVALPVTLYLTIKFSLVTAVIVLGRIGNPVTAMRKSWGLTKGNSFRLFVFFTALVLLSGVIGLIVMLIVGLILSALPEQVALIGSAAFFGVLLTIFYTVSFALTAAIYRQLSEPLPEAEADLFG